MNIWFPIDVRHSTTEMILCRNVHNDIIRKRKEIGLHCSTDMLFADSEMRRVLFHHFKFQNTYNKTIITFGKVKEYMTNSIPSWKSIQNTIRRIQGNNDSCTEISEMHVEQIGTMNTLKIIYFQSETRSCFSTENFRIRHSLDFHPQMLHHRERKQ